MKKLLVVLAIGIGASSMAFASNEDGWPNPGLTVSCLNGASYTFYKTQVIYDKYGNKISMEDTEVHNVFLVFLNNNIAQAMRCTGLSR